MDYSQVVKVVTDRLLFDLLSSPVDLVHGNQDKGFRAFVASDL